MGTFKSARKSAKKSVFANKSAQKSTLKSTFGSSEPIWLVGKGMPISLLPKAVCHKL